MKVKQADTGLLEMKVIAAVTIVAFVHACSYVGFYSVREDKERRKVGTKCTNNMPRTHIATPYSSFHSSLRSSLRLLQDPESYWEQLGKIINDIFDEIDMTFTLDVNLAFAWPSDLSFEMQFPLIMSIAIIGIQSLEKVFAMAWRKFSFESWGYGTIGGGKNRRSDGVFVKEHLLIQDFCSSLCSSPQTD